MKGRVNKQLVFSIAITILITLSIVLPALADGSIAGG